MSDSPATMYSDMREKYEAEKAIVDRVWKALGIETHAQATPLTIWEHVENLRQRLKAAEEIRDQLHAALNRVLGLVHRDIQDSHARLRAIEALAASKRSGSARPITAAFAHEVDAAALASRPQAAGEQGEGR